MGVVTPTTTTTDDIRDAVVRAVEQFTDLRESRFILDISKAPNKSQDDGFSVIVSQRNTDAMREKAGGISLVESDIEITAAYRLNPKDHRATLRRSNEDADTIRANLINDLRPPMWISRLSWVEIGRPEFPHAEWLYRRVVLRAWWQLGLAS